MDMFLQTELSVEDNPKLCVNKRDATNEIKSACAQISSVCEVSVENHKSLSKLFVKPSITTTSIFLLLSKLKMRKLKSYLLL